MPSKPTPNKTFNKYANKASKAFDKTIKNGKQCLN